MKDSSSNKSKVSKVPADTKIAGLKPAISEHKHFLAVLILFAGLSMYAIASFVTSNNQQINRLATDVTSPDEGVAVYEEDLYSRENPFSDLIFNHDSYEAVIALYYEGIINGYGDGTFQPDKKVNRAEFSKMIVEAADLDYTVFPAADLANCFADVKDLPADWFAPAVCAAKYKGWVNGYEGGIFGANKNIVKAEGLKIVLKAFDFDVPEVSALKVVSYKDIDMEKDWFAGVAEAGKQYGLVKASKKFDGAYQLSRADLAQIIYNAMKVKGGIK